jgi:hypothetical protein
VIFQLRKSSPASRRIENSMSAPQRDSAELYAEGCVALIAALGSERAARFLSEHREGIRDYTAERWEWLGQQSPLTLDEARERLERLRAESVQSVAR